MFFGIATAFEIFGILGFLGLGVYQFLCRIDGWLDKSSDSGPINWDGLHEQLD